MGMQFLIYSLGLSPLGIHMITHSLWRLDILPTHFMFLAPRAWGTYRRVRRCPVLCRTSHPRHRPTIRLWSWHRWSWRLRMRWTTTPLRTPERSCGRWCCRCRCPLCWSVDRPCPAGGRWGHPGGRGPRTPCRSRSLSAESRCRSCRGVFCPLSGSRYLGCSSWSWWTGRGCPDPSRSSGPQSRNRPRSPGWETGIQFNSVQFNKTLILPQGAIQVCWAHEKIW